MLFRIFVVRHPRNLSLDIFILKIYTNFQMKKTTRSLKNLMSIPDYARDKNVTVATVYNWINSKKIETVDVFGKKLVDISTLK